MRRWVSQTVFLLSLVFLTGCSHTPRRVASPPYPHSTLGMDSRWDRPAGYTSQNDPYSWSVITDPVVLGGGESRTDSDFTGLYPGGITALDTLAPPDSMAWSPADWIVSEVYDPYYFDLYVYPKQYVAYQVRQPYCRWGYYDYIHYNTFFYPSYFYAWGWYGDPYWFDRGAVVIYDYPLSTTFYFSYWPALPYAYSPYDYYNPFWGCAWYDPWFPYRIGPSYAYWDPWYPWGYWGYGGWWWCPPVIIVKPDDHGRPRERRPMTGDRNPEVRMFSDSGRFENSRTVRQQSPRSSQYEPLRGSTSGNFPRSAFPDGSSNLRESRTAIPRNQTRSPAGSLPRAEVPGMDSGNLSPRTLPAPRAEQGSRSLSPSRSGIMLNPAATRDGITPDLPLTSPDTGHPSLSLQERRALRPTALDSSNDSRLSDMDSPSRTGGSGLYLSPAWGADSRAESSRMVIPLDPGRERFSDSNFPSLSIPRPGGSANPFSSARDYSAPRSYFQPERFSPSPSFSSPPSFSAPREPSFSAPREPSFSAPRGASFGNMSSPGRSLSPRR
ncbi:MAG: hypothetical protein ACE15F_22140 [bacterium]